MIVIGKSVAGGLSLKKKKKTLRNMFFCGGDVHSHIFMFSTQDALMASRKTVQNLRAEVTELRAKIDDQQQALDMTTTSNNNNNNNNNNVTGRGFDSMIGRGLGEFANCGGTPFFVR